MTRDDNWTRATLGSAAASGDPITVWCNNYACPYRLAHGRQYRVTLTAADLAHYAQCYGEATSFAVFRARLRCRHCGSGDVSTIVDDRPQTPEERWAREETEPG
jgi:hypothetical protein